MLSKKYNVMVIALLIMVITLLCLMTVAFDNDTLKTNKGARAVKNSTAYDASVPKPTLEGIRYGEHERHIIDFWQATSDKPAPLVFVIHGGGWKSGSKERVQRFVNVQQLLDAGISVVAINYLICLLVILKMVGLQRTGL